MYYHHALTTLRIIAMYHTPGLCYIIPLQLPCLCRQMSAPPETNRDRQIDPSRAPLHGIKPQEQALRPAEIAVSAADADRFAARTTRHGSWWRQVHRRLPRPRTSRAQSRPSRALLYLINPSLRHPCAPLYPSIPNRTDYGRSYNPSAARPRVLASRRC